MKEHLLSFFQKLKSAGSGRQPKGRRTVFLCSLISGLLCAVVLAVTVLGHARWAGADPLTGIADGRSFVLDPQVALLYAQANQTARPQGTDPQVAVVDNQRYSGAAANSVTDSSSLGGAAAGETVSGLSTPRPYTQEELAELIENNFGQGPVLNQSSHETPTGTGSVPQIKPSEEPQYVDPEATEPTEESTPEPPVSEDPLPPQLFCNFPLGGLVNQSLITVEVLSADAAGFILPTEAQTVLCNGVAAVPRFVKDDVVTYALTLAEGINTVSITATDNLSGTSITNEYTIEYQLPETPVITICVEATTVGFGYLIPPTAVPYEEGKPLSYYVTELLKSQGYSYTSTGTVESDFYLRSIDREGAFGTPFIPEDLKSAILADQYMAPAYDETAWSPDKLSENHFVFNYSGWMFQINDQNCTVGMSQLFPAANDIIRLRYSLALGKDIGCAFDNSGNYIGWDKEW